MSRADQQFLVQRNHGIFLCMAAVFLVLPGCVTPYKMLKTEVPQGATSTQKKVPQRTAVLENLRSITVYDQFITLATFDALLMTPAVIESYATLQAHRRGGDERLREAYVRRLSEETQDVLFFYVLAVIAGNEHTSLTDKRCPWHVTLRLGDGRVMQPLSLKEIEPYPELTFLFGQAYTSFKTVYTVTFPARDAQGMAYLTPGNRLELMFHSINRAVTFVYNDPQVDVRPVIVEESALPSGGPTTGVLREDFYWF